MAVSEREGYTRLGIWASMIGLFATLSYVGRYAVEDQVDDPLYLWSSAVGGAIQFAFVLTIVLALTAGRPARETLALRRPRSWRRAAALLFSLLVVLVVASAALAQVASPGEEQGLAPDEWDGSRAAPFAANFVVVGLLAPVVEELAFRGLGFSLLARFGRWAAIVGVGLAFALAHGLLIGLPLLFLFGAGLAYIRSETGSVYPGIAFHALYNCGALVLSVAT